MLDLAVSGMREEKEMGMRPRTCYFSPPQRPSRATATQRDFSTQDARHFGVSPDLQPDVGTICPPGKASAQSGTVACGVSNQIVEPFTR
jgi:hypothetical protein